jgi:hypothetical protein
MDAQQPRNGIMAFRLTLMVFEYFSNIVSGMWRGNRSEWKKGWKHFCVL